MTTAERRATGAERQLTVEQKADRLRELFADAPEMARVALDNVLKAADAGELERSSVQAESAGRIGKRLGNVSELTVIAPLVEGGAKRLHAILDLLQGDFHGAELVGTVHDMRFVFLDDDTKLLFATAYDGEWDPYINDFATKIPDFMDILFSNFEGWPGIHNVEETKDWIVEHQHPADAWYVANPDMTVVDGRRLERIGSAVDEFLDKISD